MSSQRRYIEPEPVTHEEVTALLAARADTLRITTALVGLALYDDDWRWAQNVFLSLLDDPDENVRGTATICLGHLARIHRRLDVDRVVPALRSRAGDPQTGGIVEDALDDIGMYLGLNQAE